jgi:hypothetical protein
MHNLLYISCNLSISLTIIVICSAVLHKLVPHLPTHIPYGIIRHFVLEMKRSQASKSGHYYYIKGRVQQCAFPFIIIYNKHIIAAFNKRIISYYGLSIFNEYTQKVICI